MSDFDMRSSDSEYYDESDEELREAFSRGDLKPGLNVEIKKENVQVNNIPKILSKTNDIMLKLPWIERLDMVNDLAPLAPELAIQMEKHEQKRANMFKGNAKIPYFKPEDDPVLNDFKREMMFHRQAQTAVIEGIKRLRALNIPTKRPDDYFAEMAKTDEHMQKVRANLIAKQEGQAKSERIRQIRDQRKMGKLLQKQTKVQREMEKKEMLDQLKKFRKGKLKNLDFLEENKASATKKKASNDKRKARDKRFGFGGKKRGLKRNTKSSSMGIDNKGSKKSQSGSKQRLGKSRRKHGKSGGRK